MYDKLYKEFPITSVCRADLNSIGYDIDNVDDADMQRLASKMGDAYCDNGFWIDLPILADAIGIPKRKKDLDIAFSRVNADER